MNSNKIILSEIRFHLTLVAEASKERPVHYGKYREFLRNIFESHRNLFKTFTAIPALSTSYTGRSFTYFVSDPLSRRQNI